MNLLRIFQQSNPEKPLGGRYKVISQLAAGGFGQTFLAHDMHLPGQPRCVVKQLKPQVSDAESLQTARRLFDTEAQVLYHLGNHDQIPRLLAHFEDNQEFYLAQELIEGEPLTEEFVSGQPWPEVRVIALLQDILQVLAFVHQQQVIHRDIKPSNLMRRRGDGRIVLIDFGAVKRVSTQMANPKTGRTNLTVSIGTQGYMPKEQLGGNPRFSSDVYAVGMIGIQALTGTHPRFLPEDPHTGEVIWHNAIGGKSSKDPGQTEGGAHPQQVSPELVAILDKMVRYDFRARYVTAGDALEALRSLPPELLASVPPPGPLPNAWAVAPSQELEIPPTATMQTLPVVGQKPNSNPPAPPAPKSQQPQFPPTATIETLPVMGQKPNSSPPTASETDPVAKHSAPTVPLSPEQRLQPSASAPSVALQEFFQKSPIKPWQILAAFAALGVTFCISKALLSPKPATQTASSSSVSAVSPATTVNSEKQAADLLSQADRQREAENYQEAITTYSTAIKLNPNEAKAHWGLCYSLNSTGKFAEAVPECELALKLNPNYPQALWSKGYAFEQQKKYQEALDLYDQALKIDPKYAKAWNNKGVALLKLNRPDEALAALDKATTEKPDDPDGWANKGAALWSLKRYNDAIASVEKALKLDPNHPNANNLRQQARLKLGR